MAEGWRERRDRLKREAREASGRVRLTYESQRARSEVSIEGRTTETVNDKEQVRVVTSERQEDVIVDQSASVRTAKPSGSWRLRLGELTAIEEHGRPEVGP